ncbi:MAG: RagB/SusD family nutrient uptake outer membrane protein [Gemmatimonadales bacterium]|nr:MAG: RagB/SusD family nutrient uptake outer membrane protein [Gemmatimonadales bacterium]
MPTDCNPERETMTMRNDSNPGVRSGLVAGFMAVAVAVAGCDLTTPNPAQIEDADIRNPAILNALLVGAESDYGRGLTQLGGGGLAIASGVLTDELVHSGSYVGLEGPSWGLAGDHWVEAQSRWSEPSRGRFTTENAIEVAFDVLTAQDLDPQSHPGVARVTFFAGMAHRALGDNFCNVVYDGGPLQPHTDAYPRAIEHFQNTITRAQNRIGVVQADPELTPGEVQSAVNSMQTLIQASNGAMAQTYLIMASEGMGDQYWELARQHAGMVETDFVFSFTMVSGDRNSNRIPAWTRSRTETTMWGTPFADWGLNVDDPAAGGDPRVPYETPMDAGEFERAHDNRRPAWMQRKYTSVGNNLPLVKGTEMRLIEAEVALAREGDIQTMVNRINEVRAHHNEAAPGWWRDLLGPDPLEMLEAGTDVGEAWVTLMRERGIELYLEVRRLSDLRRWQNTPGRDFVPFEVVRRDAGTSDPWADQKVWVYSRERGETVIPPNEMCLQVSRDEKSSNPNIGG